MCKDTFVNLLYTQGNFKLFEVNWCLKSKKKNLLAVFKITKIIL